MSISTGHMRFKLLATMTILAVTRLNAQSAPWARPHIFASVDAGHDDQPITFVKPSIAGWMYLTNWTTIGAKVSTARFQLSDTVSRQLTTASATASQALWAGKVALDGEIGMVSRSWAKATDGIVSGRAVVQPTRWATITGRAERFLYTSTERSLSADVMPTRLSAELSISTPAAWMAQAAYQDTRFNSFALQPSDNHVTAAYAWLLAPVPGVTPGMLQIGYSVSASNSTTLMYALARPSQRLDLTGIYSPYYTPRDQLVHSALASMTLARGITSFHVNGAFGFHATENAPHIIAATPTPRGPATQIAEVARSFNPWNLRATVTSAVSKNASLVVGAEALRTAFYTAQTATLSLDYTLGR